MNDMHVKTNSLHLSWATLRSTTTSPLHKKAEQQKDHQGIVHTGATSSNGLRPHMYYSSSLVLQWNK